MSTHPILDMGTIRGIGLEYLGIQLTDVRANATLAGTEGVWVVKVNTFTTQTPSVQAAANATQTSSVCRSLTKRCQEPKHSACVDKASDITL